MNKSRKKKEILPLISIESQGKIVSSEGSSNKSPGSKLELSVSINSFSPFYFYNRFTLFTLKILTGQLYFAIICIFIKLVLTS